MFTVDDLNKTMTNTVKEDVSYNSLWIDKEKMHHPYTMGRNVGEGYLLVENKHEVKDVMIWRKGGSEDAFNFYYVNRWLRDVLDLLKYREAKREALRLFG